MRVLSESMPLNFYIRIQLLLKNKLNRKLLILGLILFINQSCTTIYREIRYGEPGIDAYKIFPSDTIKPGGRTFHFKEGNKAILNEALLTNEDVKHIRTLHDSLPFTLDYFLKKTGTTAFVVIRNDSILFERYYRGYGRGKISTIFSVSKSITSLLVGLAVDEGSISSVRDPVTKYIPELKGRDPKFDRLTIENLLNMRAGLKFTESYLNPFGRLASHYYGGNQLGKIKKLKFNREPGEKFEYQSVSSALLGIAVEKATGMPLAKYLQEKVWVPLGMEYGASWSLDDKRHRVAKAYGGLNATALDLIKIGRLYLQKGKWEGKQVVSEDWVKKSTIPDEQSNGYQYQWRFITSNSKESYPDSVSALAARNSPGNRYSKCIFKIWNDGSPGNSWRIWYIHPYFYAYGFDGQVLGVCPDKNLIMVRIGEGDDFQLFMYFLSSKL